MNSIFPILSQLYPFRDPPRQISSICIKLSKTSATVISRIRPKQIAIPGSKSYTCCFYPSQSQFYLLGRLVLITPERQTFLFLSETKVYRYIKFKTSVTKNEFLNLD